MRDLLQSKTIKRISLLLSIGFILISCKYNVLYDQYQIIENTVWDKNKEYYFTFHVEKIDIPYDITLEIRNNNQYPYQNLWLFCGEERPVGALKRDTIECVLADDYGKWYGQGISLFHLSIPLKTNYYFTHKGQYTFSFRQGMRNDQLKGIQELGLKVAPSINAHALTNPTEEK